MRRVLLLAISLTGCATATPAEFDAVGRDFSALAADVAIAAMDGAPEFVALKAKIDAKDYVGALSAAIALGEKLGAQYPQIAAEVALVRADLRALMTEAEVAGVAK